MFKSRRALLAAAGGAGEACDWRRNIHNAEAVMHGDMVPIYQKVPVAYFRC